ncbi:MAG TPA: histidine phosphatase family protein [Candidatus Acidoferrum sp.]|nr:histidine phosphatase family protein [Candidatus Acidoferrum sp.]
MSEITLPVVRHVPTALNEKGISRSWLRVGPDPEKLKELGPGIVKTLKGLGVGSLESSDLPRASGTATYLADELGVPTKSSFDWRTWNSGSDVSGKKESETIPIRQKYIRHSDTKPRGGEEFQEFLDRAEPELKRVIAENGKNPGEPKALVLHGHHMMALEDMMNDRPVDPKRLETLDKDYPPGSVSVLHIGDGEARLERIHPKGQTEKL